MNLMDSSVFLFIYAVKSWIPIINYIQMLWSIISVLIYNYLSCYFWKWINIKQTIFFYYNK